MTIQKAGNRIDLALPVRSDTGVAPLESQSSVTDSSRDRLIQARAPGETPQKIVESKTASVSPQAAQFFGDVARAALSLNPVPVADPFALAEVANASTLLELGLILERLATASSNGIVAALVARFAGRPLQGGRSGVVNETQNDLMVLAGRAGQDAAGILAKQLGVELSKSSSKLFSTGDPFAVLAESPKDKNVIIVQGEREAAAGEDAFDLPTLVIEALQQAFAARTHGARSVTVVLPEHLDPLRYDDPFARLVATLCEATGVDKVEYTAALNTPGSDEAAGLEPAAAFLNTLDAAFRSATSVHALLGVLRRADSYVSLMRARSRDAEAQVFANAVIHVFARASRTLEPKSAREVETIHQDERTIVYAGSANPALGVDIARALNATQVITDVAGREVVIVQTTRQSPEVPAAERRSAAAMLIEALTLAQSAREAGAKDVRLVLPYMLSARSDKSEGGPGNYVGAYARLVGLWASNMGVADVTLVTPHDLHTPSYFLNEKTKVNVVDGLALLTERIVADVGKDKLILATPDEGATKRTAQIAKAYGLDVLKGQKHRDGHDDKATVESIGDGKTDLSDKIAIVPDDEVGSGGTLKQAAAAIKKQGPKGVYVAVAHNNMVMDSEKRVSYFRSLKEIGVEGVYFLDTQPMGPLPADLDGFVKVVSVAAAIAEALS